MCIANAIDTLRLTIFRAPTEGDRERIHNSNYPQQDQAVFWRPLDKLIVSESPIVGFDWVTQMLGIKKAKNIWPENSCGSLFKDVVTSKNLQMEISEWCADSGGFELIVHTTTPET